MSDLIDRQAVLDSLKEHRALYCDNTPETFSKLSYAEKSRVDELDTAIATIVNLPSAENKGEWIAQDIHNCHTDFKCSKCGYIHDFMHLYGEPTADYTYCPNCGADMREPKGKIRCNTCKNNDDELSGECYECVKGIFDHYEKTEVENGRTND